MRVSKSINEIVLEWYLNTDVLKISKESYRKKLGYWFRWLQVSGLSVRSPSRSNLLDYKASLQERGLRESTVDSYMKAVKSFYTYCEERGYCHNIAAGIRMSRRSRTHAKRALSKEEARRLVGSISTLTEKGLRDKIIILLMVSNGLRSVEVERLRVRDWNNDRLLRVQRKGRFDLQQIRISEEIDDMISEYMSCRSSAEPDEPLFINHSHISFGSAISRQSISKMVKERLRSVGIDSRKVTSHSLRHTCAQMLFHAGAKVEDVQIILGHTNLSTTKIYLPPRSIWEMFMRRG